MLGEQVGNFMIAMVDTVLAGRISKEAIAAVGTAAYMGWFFMVAFQLLAIGSGALVARLFGQRDIKTAERALNQAVISAAVMGVVLSVAVFSAAPLLAEALTRTEEARRLCVIYLRVDSIGFLLASVQFIGAVVLVKLDHGELIDLVFQDSETVDFLPPTYPNNPAPPQPIYWYLWMERLL
ncbi:MAG: hypothetical protein IID33_11385, partial [Planctomycetes bacterium]|nr:hypothetical protein [Planctomycetota bacterium]